MTGHYQKFFQDHTWGLLHLCIPLNWSVFCQMSHLPCMNSTGRRFCLTILWILGNLRMAVYSAPLLYTLSTQFQVHQNFRTTMWCSSLQHFPIIPAWLDDTPLGVSLMNWAYKKLVTSCRCHLTQKKPGGFFNIFFLSKSCNWVLREPLFLYFFITCSVWTYFL